MVFTECTRTSKPYLLGSLCCYCNGLFQNSLQHNMLTKTTTFVDIFIIDFFKTNNALF